MATRSATASCRCSSSLQNNGGQTDTFALQSNSPAIDAVPIANCPPTDQRGDPRPADGGNACDIGAFEGSFEASPTPTATATRRRLRLRPPLQPRPPRRPRPPLHGDRDLQRPRRPPPLPAQPKQPAQPPLRLRLPLRRQRIPPRRPSRQLPSQSRLSSPSRRKR